MSAIDHHDAAAPLVQVLVVLEQLYMVRKHVFEVVIRRADRGFIPTENLANKYCLYLSRGLAVTIGQLHAHKPAQDKLVCFDRRLCSHFLIDSATAGVLC